MTMRTGVDLDALRSRPAMAALLARLEACLAPLGPRRCLLGFSGGADSTALALALAVWHRTAQMYTPRRNAPLLVHVHHGLQVQADDWVQHCEDVAIRLGLALKVIKVDVGRHAGGTEGAARAARYQAWEAMMQSGDVMLLAHHQRDQAETVLLRLLRGAGADGLGAMRDTRRLGAGRVCRPLLDVTPERLHQAVNEAGLQVVDDPSNADTSLDRAFVRQRVLPLLRERWPGADKVLARTAQLSQETARLVGELAGAGVVLAAGSSPGTLSRRGLADMPADEARAVLRHWLALHGFGLAGARALGEMHRQLSCATHPHLRFDSGDRCVRCYRDDVYVLPRTLEGDPRLPLAWDLRAPMRLSHGVLRASTASGRGLAVARLGSEDLLVRYRRERDRVEFGGGRHRSLKKLFQDHGVPPWERVRWPLLCRSGQVLAVPGLFVSAAVAASGSEEGYLIEWERDSAVEDCAGGMLQ